ncbi:MAG: N-6 DNA methylase [Candidatus Poribacteria bacterium]|nr:N-6 DNA methylase [Candidatus Poribacteria bacterium]MDE0504899.1 N-6 DNA methylase [Candidatus Poribacteria bacterium]
MSIDAKKLPDAVKNQSLFSDYYLESLVVEQPQWVDTPDIESDYAAIKQLFDAVVPNAPNRNESQLEHEFIQPLLKWLAHVFEVQPTLQTPQSAKRPDYAFFASTDVHEKAQPHINTNQFFQTALALGDAKAWSRNLDRKVEGTGDPFNNQNPNYQIDFYLRCADKDWGILTNGRQWRLYHRQSSYRLDSFYEVDLAALLGGNGDLDSFRYFYCLFRRDAFIPDASGRSFLDLVLAESQQHTIAVSDDLKNRVYDALRLLIGGFLHFPRNGFDKDNPPLDELHSNCLILLYRLLFTLYAESRGLLPLDNRDYAIEYSLDRLTTDVHEKLDSGITFAPGASRYWTRLQDLFTLINDGWEDHIPQYNGGLFNPKHHPFLEKYRLGDAVLAPVIELLTHTAENERITYRDLDVRHLGNIYEGLLEYQPQIADQDLVIVSKKKSETVAPPIRSNQEIAYREGEVYLLTDKGERKATGSYYTPEYIVRYIVENTLAPLCKDKSVDEILSLKVLDPATGSGHFLVGVVDYLAEELITHPKAPFMTETESEETELAYWRRRVVESCVYGVDLNPMAVELAKLSLWLHTVAKGEPLSFLDHHIRCGNSLIGAKIENLSNLPDLKKSRRRANEHQPEFAMEFPFTDTVARAIGHYLLIEKTGSRNADQIHAKERELDIAQTMLRFHKGVANLWTSVYFENDVSRSDYDQALKSLRAKNTDTLENLHCYRRAQEIGKEKRFFHWEIEFPDVFRDKYGREKDNPGFDAVIGNPPYVDIKGLERTLSKYIFDEYSTARLRINLFAAYMERAISVSQSQNGKMGLIIPTSFLTQVSYANLRKLILSHYYIQSIIRLPNELFGRSTGEVKVDTCIVLVQKSVSSAQPSTQVMIYDTFERVESLSPKTATTAFEISQQRWTKQEEGIITLTEPQLLNIINHIEQISTSLENLCEFCLGLTPYDKYSGHTKEQIEDKIFHAKSQSDTTCRKLLLSGDIQRYVVEWKGKDWIKYGPWLAAPREQRFFKQERILVQQIIDWSSLRMLVGWTDEELYNTQNQFNLLALRCTNLKFILSILNSRLMSFYHRQVFLDVALQRFQKILIKDAKSLPIRRINFTTPDDERARQLEKAKTLYEFCLNKGSTECVLGFVKHHLAVDPERADIVHDLLAFLAEQMVEMNKAKGEEIRNFLHWLGREIGKEIDSLQSKTAIRSYFDLSYDQLLGILKKNRRFMQVDPSSRSFQESLERGFNCSLAKLKPLLARIQQTDELIDKVVYQLYD